MTSLIRSISVEPMLFCLSCQLVILPLSILLIEIFSVQEELPRKILGELNKLQVLRFRPQFLIFDQSFLGFVDFLRRKELVKKDTIFLPSVQRAKLQQFFLEEEQNNFLKSQKEVLMMPL